MIDTGALNVGGRRTAGSGGGGGGGVSATWVDENYISKAFFNQLFTIHSDTVTQADPNGEVIEPNDVESTVASIQALVGLWTEEYLSALGLNSGGGGGGGVTLNEPLASINQMNRTPSNGQTLIYQNNQWTYGSISAGGVTSIIAGTGLSGGTITTSGTIALNSTSQTYLSEAHTAYGWGNHATAGYASASSVQTLQGYFDGSGNAKSALKLTTVSKKAWGQTYWTSGGVPTDISGTLQDVEDVEIKNGYKLKWKNSGGTLLGMITLSSSNEFVLGESTAANSYTTYLRGHSIIFQSGYTSGSTVNNASLDSTGLFTVKKLKIGSIVISEDTSNGGLHIENAGLYADTYISALGSNSGGGGGGGAYIPISGSADIAGSLIPSTTNSYDLGSSSKRWKNIYCNSLSVYSSMSVMSMSLNSINVSTSASISSGAKFASICIESNSSGAYDASRSGEINRYAGILHLQYNTANGITLCQGGGNVEFGARGSSGHLFSFNKNKLVIGDVYLYQSSDDIVFDGTDAEGGVIKGINGMTITTGSDIRLKDVKNDAVCDVETIAKAPVFNFEWKANKKRQHLGTSAQYWQTVFANAIYEDGDGHLSMDYGATALAAAVMTARRVVELEKEIAELKSKLQQS